ncbi:rRNA maturation RNase YbeY [Rhodohalobacter sp.]|uniref:rRNA maturation RNase YbeY n=1 Tax=Rhodohalobacter sp. TaxID=1974210 RepID=UPI002ACD619D|nr:rRNA maturation RNase YbeY [Rhodohalobacter sp.]MDZ7757668.1 rRNA maturation RNase YbeY [Rhodohalobacter sp.]
MMTNFPDIPTEPENKLIINNESGESVPVEEQELLKLIEITEKNEDVRFKEIELVYVDEDEIVRINHEFLDRDYITDIITFRYDEDDQAIEGTLYCCAPRISEQSVEFNDDPKTEFLRVFVHGLIHLAGHDDQTPKEKKQMTDLEDQYLNALKQSM